MKVLMQNRSDSFQKWGGDTTQMMETKYHLEKLGIDVDISLKENHNLIDYDIVHIFNIQNPSYGIKQLYNAKKFNKPIVLSSIYWDLDYARNAKENYIYSEIPLVRIAAKINLNIPHITSKILYYKKNTREYNLTKKMLSESDIILPNSYSELEIIIHKFQMPQIRSKSLVVPNGVSESKFKHFTSTVEATSYPSDLKMDENYILEVGEIGTWKGQIKLIEALFDFPDIPLVFVGRGLDTYYGKQCIKMGKKRGNTFFLGKISQQDVYSYYKNAKVHVLPSLRESPGLSTLEAAIFGVNCVVSIQGPVNEYFGFDVFYCEPRDISSIQNAVLRAWDSPKKIKLKCKILSKFTWGKAAESTLEAYNHIMNKH